MAQFLMANGPAPTSSSQATLSTTTTLLTLLQVKASATKTLKVKEWGISFDGSAAATPIKCELLQTDVAATVTAYAEADIVDWDADALMGGDETTNLLPVGSTSSGYNASGEGTITATRVFDPQLVPPTQPYVKQYPLGSEPMIEISKFLRIRVKAGTAVNCYAYVIVEV